MHACHWFSLLFLFLTMHELCHFHSHSISNLERNCSDLILCLLYFSFFSKTGFVHFNLFILEMLNLYR